MAERGGENQGVDVTGFDFRRTAMETESPEEIGYEAIRANLAESSMSDRSLADLGVALDDLTLFYGDHRVIHGCGNWSRRAATCGPRTCSPPQAAHSACSWSRCACSGQAPTQ